MEKKQLMIDPVRGMKIDPKTAAGKVEYQGQTVYFCAESCEQEFKRAGHKTKAHTGSSVFDSKKQLNKH